MDTRYNSVGGERCDNCGEIYKICWNAPDDIFQKINGSLDGLLCPPCFDALCAANGISLSWECRAVENESGIAADVESCVHP